MNTFKLNLYLLFSFLIQLSFGQAKVYSEDFDTDNGGWSLAPVITPTEAWSYGNSSFGGNSTGHWHTIPFNNYTNNLYLVVHSPEMDFSGRSGLTFSLRLRYNTETGYDGANIQYTTDNGNNWTRLGNVGSSGSSRWYNDTDVDAIANNEDGWAGDNGTWRTSSIPLPAPLNGQSSVYFRIVFASDFSVVDDGVAFDDVQVMDGGVTVYDENFNSNNGGWSINPISTSQDWTRSSSSFGGNTTGHWHSNPFNNYNNNMKSTVVSPVLDLSDFEDMTLNIRIRYNTETNWDGVNIEYTTNGGTIWTRLGSVGSSGSTNWYNDTDVDGIGNGVDGWSGDNSSWQTASISLPTVLENNSNVQFRVRIGSDGSITDDGFAFDDVAISVNYDDITIKSGDFQDPSTWQSGTNPANGATLIIDKSHDVSLTTNEITGEILMRDGSNLDLQNNTLELTSSCIINNGTGTFDEGTGKVRYSGSSSQDITGFTYYDLELAGSDVKTLKGATRIKNGLTVTGSNITLITSNQLTIGSDNSETAYVGELPSDFTITGNVTVERHVGALQRKWWHLSTPVSGASASQWQDDFPITGDFTGMNDLGGSNNASVKWYDEAVSSASTSKGWEEFPAVGGSNTENMVKGRGYRAFLRSDGSSSLNNVTIDLTGTLNTGNTNLGVSYTSSGNPSADGWSFVGNPYASTIDWDASDWTKTNLDGAIYVWDALQSKYATYIGGIGANGGSRYIASGQAFWVKATGTSPLLRATEKVKVENDRALLRNNTTNIVDIQIVDGEHSSNTVLRFSENGTYSFDSKYDAHFWNGSYPVNLCTYNNENTYFSINTLPLSGEQEIPLWIKHPQEQREFHLNITGLNSTEVSNEMTLYDKYLDIETPLTSDLDYPFSYDGNQNSMGSNRFVIRKKPTVLNNEERFNNENNIGVYPNPSSIGNFIVQGTDITNITMISADGKETNVTFEMLQNKKAQVDCSQLPVGIYTLKISSESNGNYFKKIILN